MNKLGIWAIAIVAAFIIGTMTANPVVEAVGGWKAAFASFPQFYTVSTSFTVVSGGTSGFELFCNDSSHAVITGYFKDIPGNNERTLVQSNAISNGGVEGWKLRLTNSLPTVTLEGVIMCVANPQVLNP